MRWDIAVPAIMTIVGVVINWMIATQVANAVVELKIKELEKNNHSTASDLKEAAKSLQTVATEFKVLAAEQAIVNKMTANTLESILKKVDGHEIKITEHGTVLELIREWMEQSERSR